MPEPHCIDCAAEGIKRSRSAPYGGPRTPRCATHWKALVRQRKSNAHSRRIEKGFGITSDQYWKIYEAQGGTCAICQRATGKAKRLAVDHEHHREGCEHPPEQGCPKCVRALLCSPCNVAIGRLGIAALYRAIEVLVNPPARKVL